MSNNNYNGCRFHFNPIMEYNTNGTSVRCALLGHPLYYLQNAYKFETLSGDYNSILGDFQVQAAKALMILMSFPFEYNLNKHKSFFNSSTAKNGGYEMVPYGYLALLGGLIYRFRYMQTYQKDLIRTWDDDGNQLYKAPESNETFFVKSTNGIRFSILPVDSNLKYVGISDIICDNMPWHIKNSLVSVFKSFVNNTNNTFNSLELKLIPPTDNGESKLDLVNGTNYVPFSYMGIKSLISVGKENNGLEILSYIDGIEKYKLHGSNIQCTLYLDSTVYCMAYCENKSIKLIYSEDNALLQLLFDKIYNHMCAAITNTMVNRNSDDCSISQTVYDKMLAGFVDTLKKLKEDYLADKQMATGSSITTTNEVNDDDIKKAIYMYMKQFWDKWLCDIYNRAQHDAGKEYTSVVFGEQAKDSTGCRPFSAIWFESQFLFINSFYQDITDKLKLNLNIIEQYLESSISSDSTSGSHVHNHLANIAQSHSCNYFCYPDFINFGKRNSDGSKDSPEQILADVFKPLPYSKLNTVNVENQFVIMLANGAQVCDQAGKYKGDSFDIHPRDTFASPEKEILPVFLDKDKNAEVSGRRFRLGYQVPAFGVAFSRQQNSLFKSVDVGMDSQQITEQSIKSLCYISQFGNSNRRAISFYGNDIYSVYSGYSYIVSVTMLGDMQIQPLMYFQLMNIPMFRGTYMIIEVKHSIKPGEFTTTFKGMKLSQIAPPMTGSWFTIPAKDSKPGDEDGDECNNETVDSADSIGQDSTSTDSTSEDTASLYSFPVNPLKIGVSTNKTSASDNTYYNSSNCSNPTTLNADNSSLVLVAPGPMFYSKGAAGAGENYGVMNGRLFTEGTENTYFGGIIIYKDGTVVFEGDHSAYMTAIKTKTSTISCAMNNYICIKNNQQNSKVNTTEKYHYRCLAQIGNSTKTLYFIVAKKRCTYTAFINALIKKGVTNAFYLDNNDGGPTGLWIRTTDRSIDNIDGKFNAKDRIYYFAGSETTTWSNVPSVMYVVK